jgi:serine/threonine protein kinase
VSDELDRSELGRLGAELGKGGQAVVYLAPQLTLPDVAGQLVYKQYKGNQVSPNGLRAIVGVRSKLDPKARAMLDSVAAWPARVVRENGAISGVVMPLIPDSFFQERILPSTGRRSRDPREVQNLFINPAMAIRLGMPAPSLGERFAICRDLAGALALLHRNGVVFGDVNAKNALFRLSPVPTIMLVDCDAVRIRGSAPVVKQLNAPDWDPPEGKVLSQATDLYKFGLFVVRTLNPGPQSSTARDPRRVCDQLDAEGRSLLLAALGPRATRTPAAAWRAYFAKRAGRPSTAGLVDPNSVPRQAKPKPEPGWRRDPATGRWVPAR